MSRPRNPKQRARGLAFTGLLLLLTLACAIVNPTPVAWSVTATPPPPAETLATLPTHTSVPLPTRPLAGGSETQGQPVTPTAGQPVPEVTTTPSSGGPWLAALGSDRQTITAIPQAGGQPISLAAPGALPFPSDLTNGASPSGGWLAFRTGSGDLSDLSLALAHLPDGEARVLTPLLSDGIRKQMAETGPGNLPHPVRAVTRPDILAWSPDGRYLAFISAASGPAADLYLYDTRADQVRRMTSALYQAAAPVWSPDGLWIVFDELLGVGAGTDWRVLSVWATATDHNELRKLYVPPANSIAEVLVGWRDPGNFVVYTQAPDAARNARSIPVSGRAGELLYGGPFTEAIYSAANGALIFTEDARMGAELGLSQGVYLVLGPKEEVQNVQAGDWSGLGRLDKQRWFIAHGPRGVLTITPEGAISLIPGEEECSGSPDGNWMTCWGGSRPGLRLYRPTGGLLQEVTIDPVDAATWRPDSKGFAYPAKGGLYEAVFPDLRPLQVSGEVLADGLGWVGK